jgi:hypothetical protein
MEKYAKKIGDQYKKAAGVFLGYLGMKDVLGGKKKQPIFAPAAEADIGTFGNSYPAAQREVESSSYSSRQG